MQKFIDSHWSWAMQFLYNTSAKICNKSANYKTQKFWFAVFEAWFKYIFHCLQQKTILKFVKRLILSKIYNYGLRLKNIQALSIKSARDLEFGNSRVRCAFLGKFCMYIINK